MTFTIRSFKPDDYPAMAAIGARAIPGLPFSVEELQDQDSHMEPPYLAQRWVAELQGQVVGMAEYFQKPGRYHPQKFTLDVWVDPDHQGKGIGSRLYDQLISALQPRNPIALQCNTREDLAHGMQFILRRGFVERMRTWESILDVQQFDPAAFAGSETVPGIQIRSLKELEGDPDRNRKLYEAFSEIRVDVPSLEPPTPIDFEQYVTRFLGGSRMIHEAYFVALDGDRYVGVSVLARNSEPGGLSTGLTGVRRAYRGRGIALALKLRALSWAKENGYRSIRTYNESNNRGMLAINQRLGFARKPAFVDFVLACNTK